MILIFSKENSAGKRFGFEAIWDINKIYKEVFLDEMKKTSPDASAMRFTERLNDLEKIMKCNSIKFHEHIHFLKKKYFYSY